MKKNETIANSRLQSFSAIRRRFDNQKLAIMTLWFLMLTGIRIFLAYVLKDIWIGTFGAVGLTFAVFYLVLSYTPLRGYRPKINTIFSQWYSKKYFVISTITISTILATLLVLIQFGYSYYGSNIVQIDILRVSDKELERDFVPFQDYPFIDQMAIVVASVDKSLDGDYAKTTSFLLAEDIEMILFVLIARKKTNIFAI
jgi:hypothetical protein